MTHEPNALHDGYPPLGKLLPMMSGRHCAMCGKSIPHGNRHYQDGTKPACVLGPEPEDNLHHVQQAPASDGLHSVYEAVKNARDFIGNEYADPRQEEYGHWLAPEAQKVHQALCDAEVMLTQPAASEPNAEACAVRYGWDGHGYQYLDNGSGSDWKTRIPDGELLYDTTALYTAELRGAKKMQNAASGAARLAFEKDPMVDELTSSFAAEAVRALSPEQVIKESK